MRILLLLLVCFLGKVDPDLETLRQLLDRSLDNKSVANEFYQQMKVVKDNDLPVIIGFRAMSEFMLCKHLLNPFSQLSHFNKGKALLESAIKKEGDSPELIFFRLTTQCNVPAVLHYNSNINTDKLKLISYLKTGARNAQGDKILHKRIKTYLLVNPHCTAAEIAMIKSL